MHAYVCVPTARSSNVQRNAYPHTAGNEPYEPYEGLDRSSKEYQQLKEQRSEVLWKAIEKIIPDVRARADVGGVALAATPLTHERFLRRNRGTYGPSIRAGKDLYPAAKTPIEGLLLCGGK